MKAWKITSLSIVLLASLAAVAPQPRAAEQPGDEVLGLWLSEKEKLLIEFYPCADELCGRIAWLKNARRKSTGEIKLDSENPDPALRHRPRCGLDVVWGLAHDGGGKWKDGRFYNPKDGSTYDLDIEPKGDGTLKLHGYLGLKILGKSEVWTRPGPEFAAGCETKS